MSRVAASRGRGRPPSGCGVFGVGRRGARGARAQRRGQVDRAARHRRAASPRRGSGAVGGPGADRHRDRSGRGDTRPTGGAAAAGPLVVPAHERRRQCRFRAARPAGFSSGARPRQGRRALRWLREVDAERSRRPQTASAVRRPGATGGDRAGVGGRTRCAAARRTAGRARCGRGRGHPRGAAHRGRPAAAAR